mgnify:CR=1 FL=1
MLKSYVEAFCQRLTGLKNGCTIASADQVRHILETCKNARAKGYIYKFQIASGDAVRDAVTTTANWHFLLCGISAYFWDDAGAIAAADWPTVSVNFENFALSSPFGAAARDVGREGLQVQKNHYEEQKRIFIDLGQRFTTMLEAKGGSKPCFGAVLLTGVEINENEFLNYFGGENG